MKKESNKFYLFPLILSSVVIILFITVTVLLPILNGLNKKEHIANEPKNNGNNRNIIKTANAAEIYTEFVCGCCGKPLDPNSICCGDMKRKIDYINEQVKIGKTKDEIMIASVKEFGISSLAKEETKEEIKSLLIAMAPADAPKIVLELESKDMGEVSQASGVESTLFNFKNEGDGNLVIDKLNTSCGCTSASIVYQGKEGPTFTMPGHGKENPTNWSVAIAPGDSAQVKVYYDPNAHGKQKEDVLSITRTISVFSNDPVDFEKRLKIELNQVP